MTEVTAGKITQDEFDDLIAPFVLDLIAVFSQLKEDVFSLLDESLKEGWTADVLIQRIEQLF